MGAKLLQVNFKYSVSGYEYTQAITSMAEKCDEFLSLRWIVWIIDEFEKIAGGIYLFNDELTLTAFLESQLTQRIISHPAFGDFDIRIFDVMEEVTSITRNLVSITKIDVSESN